MMATEVAIWNTDFEKAILENNDIKKNNPQNINICIGIDKNILETIDIDIDKDIIENIDIDIKRTLLKISTLK